MIKEPMNPYATEDFKNAIKEASAKLGEDLKRIGEQMKMNTPLTDVPFVDFADMGEEYSGVMRLEYNSVLDVSDVIEKLIENGYEVSVRLEGATEVERELDGAKQFVVIAFEEVE